MPNTTQTIGPLIGGVSQAPSYMRSPEYATELVNALAHPALGTTKRPGTRHIAKLDNSEDGHYAAASLFPFSAGDKRRYILSLSSGTLRVVEADTGVERTVIMGEGAADYLSGTLDPVRPFAASSSGDTTYIANRNRVVAMGADDASTRPAEAVVAINAADYGTTYSVTLNGSLAYYKTPDGTSADVRSLISTDAVAEQLALAIADVGGDGFAITRSGSALHITRTDGGNFTLTTGDGLADEGIALVYGTISSGIDLPPTGVVDGFTVRVIGDPKIDGDDFWMTWKDGVWQECARPGSRISLDASTMPHALILGGALHDGIVVPPAPPTPIAQIGGTEVVQSWQGYPPNSSIHLKTGGSVSAATNVLPADGSDATVVVEFDLDTSYMTLEWMATVTLYQLAPDDSSTPIATQDYQFGVYYTKQALTKSGVAFSTGDRLQLELSVVASGNTPPDSEPPPTYITNEAELIVGGAGVRYTPTDASQLSIPPAVVYPESAVVTVVAQGNTLAHTVAAGGETGAAIATALRAAWSASGTACTDLGGGKLMFRNTVLTTPPTLSASCTFDPAARLWVSTGGLTPAALVGLRIVDLTTGAEATIASNTAHVIVFGTLAGGSSAALREGDLVRVSAAPDTFSFARVKWLNRTAGDDASNAAPSFIGRTISNIGVTQNRLVFTTGENVVASAAGKFGSFFRTTTQQVVDSDPIDVSGTASHGLPWWHLVDWNETLHLTNGRAIYALSGDPLTPRSVGLPHVYEVSTDETCVPVVVGRRLYVARVKNGYTQLLGLEAAGAGVGVDSIDSTGDVPLYIVGSPLFIAADAEGPLVIISEKNGTRFIYAMQPVNIGRGTAFAWASWTFDPGATPLAATMDDGDLVLVTSRSDGVYLESLDTLAHLT